VGSRERLFPGCYETGQKPWVVPQAFFSEFTFFNLLPFSTCYLFSPKEAKNDNFRHSQLAAFCAKKRQQVQKGSNFRNSQLAAFLAPKKAGSSKRQQFQTFTTCCLLRATTATG
jgi:hypothetical protein